MHQQSSSKSYQEAGVNIEAGYEVVERIKKHINRTLQQGESFDGTGFSGLLPLNRLQIENPCLVSATDGVGTKLKLAFLLDKHDTVGIDCVAMCVNDLICCGAKPINFLDYIACGKNDPEKIEQIVKGVVEGCIQSNIPLVGGETAEMPGFYSEDEYDLAGFANGVVDQYKVLDKNNAKADDLIIGLASSGVHSNGFSLVRKVFDIKNVDVLNQTYDVLKGQTLGEVLLTPTKIYVQSILPLIEKNLVKSIAHITGGGFYENIPRALPDHLSAVVKKDSFEISPIFQLIQQTAKISEKDMFNTFNMGIGMILIVDQANATEVLSALEKAQEQAYIIGKTIAGNGTIEIE